MRIKRLFLVLVFPILLVLGLTGSTQAAAPGSLKWAYPTGDTIFFSSPALAPDGTLYVGTLFGSVHAVNPDGTEKWVFYSDEDFFDTSPAIGDDGTIYVASAFIDMGRLYAFNQEDGSPQWVFQPGGGIACSPAIGPGGIIYFGAGDGNLYAVNPDGSEKWRFPLDTSASSPAVALDGTIYVGAADGKVYAVNPDGSKKWDYATEGGPLYSSPAVGAEGTVYFGSYDSYLYALNQDGSLKWRVAESVWSIGSSPVIGPDGVIYAANNMLGYLSAYKPADGSTKWSVQVTEDGMIESVPAIGRDGTIYVGADDGFLYALKPDGSQRWAFGTLDVIKSSPVIGPDGTVYVGSQDGNLYAVVSSSFGLANTPWPMFRHDPRRTGNRQTKIPAGIAPATSSLLFLLLN